MKICCSQEHYDKVVQYAKSINDKTLENCLERLKQWEKNAENRPCEIELYYDHAPYSFDSANVILTGIQALFRRTAVSWNRRVFAVIMERFHGMEHTYLTYMRQSVLGSLMQYGVLFLCRRHDDSILISCCKIAVCRATPRRRPCRVGCLKNHPRFARAFFSAKPCRDAGKQTTGTTRNKNACTLAGRQCITINIRSHDYRPEDTEQASRGYRTELFSIRQRKEAVTRMLDILKETP